MPDDIDRLPSPADPGEPVDPAVEGLRRAVEMAPADVELRRMLGQRLLAASSWEQAAACFKELVRQEPGDVDARVGLSRAYLGSGRPGAAVLVLDEAVAAAPARADVRYLHARALAASGDREGAVLAYRRGYDLDPTQADVAFAMSIGATASPAPVAGDGGDAGDLPDDAARYQQAGSDLAEKPKITFDDVGGMDGLKEEVRLKIIHPFTNPELYAAYGQAAGGGLLLYGPPGCGKTYLARATAGEIGASFVSVGIADILDMWIGASERNLHEVFQVARGHRPCVLFFDEADALASDRSKFTNTAGRTVINQFLAELDGVSASNDGILVLAATNAPWQVDSAFRRPGRFDRTLFVPPPDQAARIEILRILLEDKPTRGVDLARIASMTDHFSGADLKGVVDRAVQGKLAAAMKDGLPMPITVDDLATAARATNASTREWFAAVRNYVLYANESGLYDPVRPYLEK